MTPTTPSRTRTSAQTRNRRPGAVAVAAYDGVTAAYLRDISRRGSGHSAGGGRRAGRSSIDSPSAAQGQIT